MNDRKKLLLIGATTGYQTRVFAEAAERLGFDLLLATDRCHVLDDPWGDQAIALRFEDPEAAAEVLAAEARVDGIVAVGDRPALLRDHDILRLHDDQDRFLQVESFIEGREFALEGILIAGKLRVLAIFDKPDPLDGPYFEETIYVTPSRQPAVTQLEIVRTSESAVKAIGLTHGPVHAEMRVNRSGVWMLEVAA